jgi:thioesterase domain-containing protein
MVRRHDRAPALIRAFWGGGENLERPRVVLVHPGALPATSYLELAAALLPKAELFVVDLEQVPEYFQAALSGGHAEITIGQLAARIDDALWERGLLAPPWLLAGWSFGGVVGHALTTTLGDDEQPEGLFLLDSIAPVPEYTKPDDELDLGLVLGWFAMYLAAKRGAPVPVSARRLAGATLDAGLRLVLDAAVAHGALRPGTPLPGLRKVFNAYTDGLLRNNRLAAAHTPAPTSVPVCLIRPERGLLETEDPLGWRSLAPNLTERRCPGDHYSMLRDQQAVQLIAAAAWQSLVGSRLAS